MNNQMEETASSADRLEREKKFHDEVYESDARSNLAGLYAASSPIRRRFESSILESCSGKRILEYGCGMGSYGFLLASRGAVVTGIDISEFAVNTAKQRAEQEGIQIDFRVMDAEKLTFEDRSFDLICGTGILHHLNIERAAAEIRRTLKPSGKAIFIEPLGHNPFVNLFRRLTPGMRSTDEHPMTVADLKYLQKEFRFATIVHYYLLSLC